MDNSYFTNPLVFLVQVIFGLYALVVMLRFVLQLVRADFYNPVSQFVVKLTSPPLNPLRRVIPSIAGMDTASLLLAWLVKTLETFLVFWINGAGPQFAASALFAIPEVIGLLINIFLFATIILAILSWVSPGGHNPAAAVLDDLTRPLLRPLRSRLPMTGGLDFSPMLLILGLILLKMLLIPPVEALIRQLLR